EQRCLRETQFAEIVAPALEQSKPHVLLRCQRVVQKRQILADELLLQIDSVGRDYSALSVRRGPAECGDQISKRFSNAGSRFQQADAASVVEADDSLRHRALSRPVLESLAEPLHRSRYGPVRTE